MKAKTIFAFFILFAFLTSPGPAGETEIRPQEWLNLGPVETLIGLDSDPEPETDLLKFEHLSLSGLQPAKGVKIRWAPAKELSWQKGKTMFTCRDHPRLVYLALYLEGEASVKAEMRLGLNIPARVFLAGEQLLLRETPTGKTTTLNLATGKHLLLVKALLPATETETSCDLEILFGFANEKEAAAVSFSLDPKRLLAAEDILRATVINNALLNKDGSLAAVFLSGLDEKGLEASSWLEIIETRGGKVVYSSRAAGSISGFRWHPRGNGFSFQKSRADKTDLCFFNLGDFSQQTLLSGASDFSHYDWSKKGDFLIYATHQPRFEATPGYRHVRNPGHKALNPPRRYNWTILYPENSLRQPLASFAADFSQALIASDGESVFLVRRESDYGSRPYQKTTVVQVNLKNMESRELFSDPWVNQVLPTPDGRKLLLVGGPSAFSGIGNTLEEGRLVNDFDGQAYLFDIAGLQAEPLSRNFDPAIRDADWVSRQQPLFQANDQDHVRLYRYNFQRRVFQPLSLEVDVLEGFSAGGNKVIYWGSGPGNPQKLYFFDSIGGRSRLFRDYNRILFADVSFGRVENLDLKISEKRILKGLLYYPARFDSRRSYPCIVYYYGGTNPVSRDFGGRYPKEWYAANGYFVYVPQPSGATGFGQEFSSHHVNDWGRISSAEIIAAIPLLLQAVPAIDGQRLGAMGASYGGFMTQYLAASTDLFAAYISHAGISSLSSYWGVGDWGYSYSAVATAESFPWNRKDIYVGHSPLFMADRIDKPLLLLHGERDNNVPVGESYQIYTALKLLGQEVELVTFADQLHFVLEPEKRLRWMKTITAWFDRWLKDEPAFWRDLYPER